MSTSSIVLMVIHLGIFFIVKTRISRRKRELEKENTALTNKLIKAEADANYYKRAFQKGTVKH